jgi:hypothetical protein
MCRGPAVEHDIFVRATLVQFPFWPYVFCNVPQRGCAKQVNFQPCAICPGRLWPAPNGNLHRPREKNAWHVLPTPPPQKTYPIGGQSSCPLALQDGARQLRTFDVNLCFVFRFGLGPVNCCDTAWFSTWAHRHSQW